MADIVIGLSLRRWKAIPMTHPSFSNVERYYELLRTRSGFKRYAVE